MSKVKDLNLLLGSIENKIDEEIKNHRATLEKLESKEREIREKLGYINHSMYEWAENEIALACKKEDSVWSSCYVSALNTYKSLCYDRRNGLSFSMTKRILNRLLEHLPLTPITDEDFVDEEPYEDPTYLKERGLKSNIQCKRMCSLFREETLDGQIRYTNVDRVYGVDVDNRKDVLFSFSPLRELVDYLYPITMPYMPNANEKPYIVEVKFGLHDKALGDFDMYNIKKIIKPDNSEVEINEYYITEFFGWYTYGKPGEYTYEKVFPKTTSWLSVSKDVWDNYLNNQIETVFNKETDLVEVIDVSNMRQGAKYEN